MKVDVLIKVKLRIMEVCVIRTENDERDIFQDHIKPYNDVTDHFAKINGFQLKENTSMNQLPKGIRVIGYFFLCFVVVAIIFTIIDALLN